MNAQISTSRSHPFTLKVARNCFRRDYSIDTSSKFQTNLHKMQNAFQTAEFPKAYREQ